MGAEKDFLVRTRINNLTMLLPNGHRKYVLGSYIALKIYFMPLSIRTLLLGCFGGAWKACMRLQLWYIVSIEYSETGGLYILGEC